METVSDTKRRRLVQYLASMTGSLGMIIIGMVTGWPSPSLPQLKDDATCSVCIDESQGPTLAVMPLVGAIFGSLVAASVVDRLGRKLTILATAVPFCLSWIMVAFAEDLNMLYVGRFIAGIGDGVCFIVVPMYITEIADAEVRGMLGSGCIAAYIGGFLVINVVGSYFSIKTTALVSSSVPVVFFVTFSWMPESPYFLLMRDKVEDARKVLRTLKGLKDVEEELTRIQTAVQDEEEAKNGRFLDLFTVPSNRKSFFILLGLYSCQQLIGTTAIAFYTHEIFQSVGGHFSAECAVVIYYSLQLALTVVSSSIVDKTGRRPLLLISITGSALALFIEATYFYLLNETSIDTESFSVVAVVGLIAFVIMSSVGMQAIPLSMVGELLPTNVKAYGFFLSEFYYYSMATATAEFLQVTKVEYGLHVSFFGFFVCAAAGVVFIYFFAPETKGKTLENIQKELRGVPE